MFKFESLSLSYEMNFWLDMLPIKALFKFSSHHFAGGVRQNFQP